MQNKLEDISINFLEIKIKSYLYSIGLNEKYISFDYLTKTLMYLIKNESDDFQTYRKAIGWLVEKYRVSSRTIIQSLHKILSMCKHTQLAHLPQFQLPKSKTIHKIRILKIHTEIFISEHSI